MAFFYEHNLEFEQALNELEQLKTTESYRHIISILKKSGGHKDMIDRYGKEVFKKRPDIALDLFYTDQDYGEDNRQSEAYSVSMSIEEILEFLDAVGENDSELDLKKNYLQ